MNHGLKGNGWSKRDFLCVSTSSSSLHLTVIDTQRKAWRDAKVRRSELTSRKIDFRSAWIFVCARITFFFHHHVIYNLLMSWVFTNSVLLLEEQEGGISHRRRWWNAGNKTIYWFLTGGPVQIQLSSIRRLTADRAVQESFEILSSSKRWTWSADPELSYTKAIKSRSPLDWMACAQLSALCN